MLRDRRGRAITGQENMFLGVLDEVLPMEREDSRLNGDYPCMRHLYYYNDGDSAGFYVKFVGYGVRHFFEQTACGVGDLVVRWHPHHGMDWCLDYLSDDDFDWLFGQTKAEIKGDIYDCWD